MSYMDELISAYRRFVSLRWQDGLAPAQRVWMAVYPPTDERRLRLHLPDFEMATVDAGHHWAEIDITSSFERWMIEQEYREEYFKSPELLAPALPSFLEHLAISVRSELEASPSPSGVVGLIGAGSLFGLGDAIRVSALLNEVNESIAGRLLVFFPGEYEGNGYRLLDAQDGWNYLATPITPKGSH